MDNEHELAGMLSQAKVQPPRPLQYTLARPRLTSPLHEHADHRLQFVIAPAGFGKTTLLTDWAHETAFPVAWATLDAGDRDPAMFVEVLIAALRHVVPGFGARTLAALRVPGEGNERMPALARTFAHEAETALEELTALVLDDFHEVDESGAVVAFMDELLRLLPDLLRIVLASRTAPRLTISRLIVERQVFGLGAAELRFTTGELITLLHRAGEHVTAAEANALAEGAEGWIAGFLLSVPQLWSGLVGGMIAAGGGEGPLYDYLAAEAFDRQTPEARRFLTATAVPEVADPEVATALLGDGDWRAMLNHIERAGLFVQRIEGTADGFRYHALFRRFLQTRLRRSDPEEYFRLHARAAAFATKRRRWPAALTHWREAGREDAAATLLARIAPEMVRASHWRVLADAVASLTIESIRVYPALLLAGARAALHVGDLVRADTLSTATVERGVALADATLEAWGLTCLGYARRLQGRTTEAIVHLERAIDLAPDDELRATARRHLGKCLGVRGDFAGMASALREALTAFDRTGAAYDAAQAEFGLGVALAKSGRVGEAIGRYRSALARWRELGDPLMEAEMLNCLGCAHAYLGEYGRAREELGGALRLAGEAGYALGQAATLHSLAETLLAAGDLRGARAAVEQGLSVAADIGELWVTTHLYDALALITAFEGDLRSAEAHAHHAIALAGRQESPYLEALCRSTLGAIQTRCGNADAMRTLTAAVEGLDAAGARRELARAHLWSALAGAHAGRADEADRHLRQALSLSEQLGSDGILDVPLRWDRQLFENAAADGVEPERLRAALARVGTDLPPTPLLMAPHVPALSARAFGSGSVFSEEAGQLPWAWEKSRELFFFLLHHGPRRREQILAALWPSTLPAQAKAALHTAVYRLRRAAGADVVLFHDGTYRVDLELVTHYDVREFERLVRESRSASGALAVDLLRRAVDLADAPFLQDVQSDWCIVERMHLDQRRMESLEHLIDAYAATSAPRDSLAAAERLLALDPFREDVHVRVIRTHLRLGDRAAARRQMDRCVLVLRDELGVAPGPELRSLQKRIDL